MTPIQDQPPTHAELTWAMTAHLIALCVYLGLPFAKSLVPDRKLHPKFFLRTADNRQTQRSQDILR